MNLYILRHAWAGHFGDPAWPNDALRPLSDEGRDRFAQVAQELAERGVAPRVIATSPLVRCRETAEILAEHVPGEVDVVEIEALLPGSDLAAAILWTASQQGDVAWVGHAPDVGDFVGGLIGGDSAAVRFAKGACAAIRFDGPCALGAGELHWHATAKMLGC